jgi:hypothetical protein
MASAPHRSAERLSPAETTEWNHQSRGRMAWILLFVAGLLEVLVSSLAMRASAPAIGTDSAETATAVDRRCPNGRGSSQVR